MFFRQIQHTTAQFREFVVRPIYRGEERVSIYDDYPNRGSQSPTCQLSVGCCVECNELVSTAKWRKDPIIVRRVPEERSLGYSVIGFSKQVHYTSHNNSTDI
jgi:hypothetical protein